MNEQETLRFLEESGVKPFPDDWQPNQPVLYVLEEVMRRKRKKDGTPFPADQVASIARLEPADIVFTKQRAIREGRRGGAINNEGGPVDYYAIDPVTKKITLVDTANSKRDYFITKEHLFAAADELFPRSDRRVEP